MQGWGDNTFGPEGTLPNIKDTGGYVTFVENLVCPTCGTFAIPCADSSGNVVACDDGASVGQLILEKQNNCAESAGHSASQGTKVVKCTVASTVTVKTGCNGCKLLLTNSGSGASMTIKGVLHWAWNGNLFFFMPDEGQVYVYMMM